MRRFFNNKDYILAISIAFAAILGYLSSLQNGFVTYKLRLVQVYNLTPTFRIGKQRNRLQTGYCKEINRGIPGRDPSETELLISLL